MHVSAEFNSTAVCLLILASEVTNRERFLESCCCLHFLVGTTMLLARISFVPHMDHEEAELVTVAEAYLASLLKNGQICGEHVTGWTDCIMHAYVRIPHRDILLPKYHSVWGQQELAAVERQFGAKPEWKILDDDTSARVPTLKSAASLYLFTHGLTNASAVMHGSRGTSIPLPLLPISDLLREELFLWQQSYLNHDRIWLDGGPLEIAAYKELAEPDSQLLSAGRDLCARIEEATGKPTYLYLLRHWGIAAEEETRPCPKCGQEWRDSSSPMPSKRPFRKFHYRCDPCRLVSHRAVAFGDAELAKIGAFPKPDAAE